VALQITELDKTKIIKKNNQKFNPQNGGFLIQLELEILAKRLS